MNYTPIAIGILAAFVTVAVAVFSFADKRPRILLNFSDKLTAVMSPVAMFFSMVLLGFLAGNAIKDGQAAMDVMRYTTWACWAVTALNFAGMLMNSIATAHMADDKRNAETKAAREPGEKGFQ